MRLPHDYAEKVYAGVHGKITGVYLSRLARPSPTASAIGLCSPYPTRLLTAALRLCCAGKAVSR